MTAIETVGSPQSRAAAQSLFREYGEFLRDSGSCGYSDHGHFDQAKFADEIATIPSAYADHGGNILLAMVDGKAAACIAYRANLQYGLHTCEIKRLFVRPGFRSMGLARKLIAEASARATARGFRRAVLDTDVDNMPGALELYQSFGFIISAPQHGPIAFLTRELTPAPAAQPEPANAEH